MHPDDEPKSVNETACEEDRCRHLTSQELEAALVRAKMTAIAHQDVIKAAKRELNAANIHVGDILNELARRAEVQARNLLKEAEGNTLLLNAIILPRR